MCIFLKVQLVKGFKKKYALLILAKLISKNTFIISDDIHVKLVFFPASSPILGIISIFKICHSLYLKMIFLQDLHEVTHFTEKQERIPLYVGSFFFFFPVTPCGIWDFNSLMPRDRTHACAPAMEAQSLHH